MKINLSADFSDITNEKIALDKIVHKAVIEVNEKGSEASAATYALFGTRSAAARPQPEFIQFDRPFLFVIQDKRNQLPLFMGRIVDPRN